MLQRKVKLTLGSPANIKGSAYGFKDLPETDRPKILKNNIVGVV